MCILFVPHCDCHVFLLCYCFGGGHMLYYSKYFQKKDVTTGATQSSGVVLDYTSGCSGNKSGGESEDSLERSGDWAESGFGQDGCVWGRRVDK